MTKKIKTIYEVRVGSQEYGSLHKTYEEAAAVAKEIIDSGHTVIVTPRDHFSGMENTVVRELMDILTNSIHEYQVDDVEYDQIYAHMVKAFRAYVAAAEKDCAEEDMFRYDKI